MNEQWRQQLKDKMEGYQRPAPEVSWEKIDQVLDARKPRQLWLWRIAAAVAVVLAIAGAGYWMTRQEPTEQPPLTAKTTSPQEPMEPMGPVSPMGPIIPISSISPKGIKQVSSGSAAQQQDTLSATPTEAPQSQDAVATTETAAINSEKPSLFPSSGKDMIPLFGRGRSLKNSATRLTAKVYLSNFHVAGHLVKPELYYADGDNFLNKDPQTNNSQDPDNGNQSPTDSTNAKQIPRRGPEGNHEIRYHQPFRIGVSLRYRLDDRWSVESGLLYTLLVTDVDREEQRHSYIGLPMNVGYQLWASHRFGLYLTAGATIEKMLDATSWQFSLNAAAGIDYQLTNRLSLYAEPGVGYYFPNGSDIPTVYQHRPFNFNLNAGLRINLK